MLKFSNFSAVTIFALAVSFASFATAEANPHTGCCKFEGRKALVQKELPQGQNEILMMRVQQMERAQKEAGTAL